eukprot:gene58673-80356_t
MGREVRIAEVDDGTYLITPTLNADGSVQYRLAVTRKDSATGAEQLISLPRVTQTPWDGFTISTGGGRVFAFDPDKIVPARPRLRSENLPTQEIFLPLLRAPPIALRTTSIVPHRPRRLVRGVPMPPPPRKSSGKPATPAPTPADENRFPTHAELLADLSNPQAKRRKPEEFSRFSRRTRDFLLIATIGSIALVLVITKVVGGPSAATTVRLCLTAVGLFCALLWYVFYGVM